MRHGKISTRLGVKSGHRIAMIRNLALGLVEHGRIRTTTVRAKRLRPFMERLVTQLKEPTTANLRWALKQLPHRAAIQAIAQNVSTKFKDRPGGYLRILKLAKPRVGDCADMSLIEWVDESLVNAYQAKPPTKGKTSKAKATKKQAAADGDKDESAVAKKKSVKKKEAPSKAAKSK